MQTRVLYPREVHVPCPDSGWDHVPCCGRGGEVTTATGVHIAVRVSPVFWNVLILSVPLVVFWAAHSLWLPGGHPRAVHDLIRGGVWGGSGV